MIPIKAQAALLIALSVILALLFPLGAAFLCDALGVTGDARLLACVLAGGFGGWVTSPMRWARRGR